MIQEEKKTTQLLTLTEKDKIKLICTTWKKSTYILINCTKSELFIKRD